MALAADSPEEGSPLLEYTLTELLSLHVETASRSIEALDRAPATVYVITADDIRTYGYRNLADALENVPGVMGINKSFFLDGGQRGLFGNFSQTLLLINGREFQGLATQEAFISDQFATDNIRQIEVMNSPGSVLYGANAYSGVINILTRDADSDFTGQQFRITQGSENTQALSLVSATRTSLGRFSVYLRQYRSDNWDFGEAVADRSHFSAGYPAVFQDASAQAGREFMSRSRARSWAARFERNGFYLGTDGYQLENGKGLEAVAMDYDSQRD
ncbi:MAG TPA: TonB-dependent receptor plug domain-containing protein, partial [Candidatus Kapabacteria bacterium]|nr:TonB-dependent receptor plug domain-containing protein [Candidatus Kapabacteria bacterium]